MKSNGLVKEIFVLRSVGCLSIVLLHSIFIALQTGAVSMGHMQVTLLDSLQLLLNFGTPMFVFISEFIIAYSYRQKPIPNSFFSKRFKFIFLPYLTMALIYALPFFHLGLDTWSQKAVMNIFVGDYHGYFILIIFQFYLFHYYFSGWLKRLKPLKVIGTAFVINLLYVAFFNFVPPPNDSAAVLYIWERFFWIPMFGWIFYFMIGFYAGTYYETFLSLLKKYRVWVMMLPVITTVVMLWLYHTEILTVNTSKRVDILFQTTAVSLLLFYLVNRMKYPWPFMVFISRYSFGIYLWHYAYIFIFDYVYDNWIPWSFNGFYFMVLFVFSLSMSIMTVRVLSSWSYGYLFIGKIGIPYRKPEKTPPAAS
ncbi:acyltransferase family protein [Salisediminibacterium selenitireducens]|uniref:Protein involved in polysaccharide intercellular adhesin (PIA) synthesis/biofilm formation-like protein n=1 Tax=Bacillus selenitireducens (strain ATCC 700615 / DSM 15326 / MLS10) TaxID=439292 RepID=D6XUF9_BACIE|nr:acyltransferase family protein [Salisediminibacterium selenitireducens]ADH99445.1 Protein involved in polysaccharide intercellular adhesin (PIA) synthesis/biofilm formation-like protein [[Bacillus] selenitireducens MLS10]